MLQRNSKLIGVIIGLLQGIPQGIMLPNNPVFPVFNDESIWMVIAFGVFAPPLLAFLNSFISSRLGLDFMRKINSYVSLYYMIIAGSISLGITGLIVFYILGGNESSLMPILFFSAGGIGFLIAYFIDPNLGYKYEQKA
ncbi:MAG: hypothetical protein D6694_15840 [Gammaproteobacteria bacterium]|nr:MAG: hypothetical protein D6694_15840 [Gammaproteobacteria bacterium]